MDKTGERSVVYQPARVHCLHGRMVVGIESTNIPVMKEQDPAMRRASAVLCAGIGWTKASASSLVFRIFSAATQGSASRPTRCRALVDLARQPSHRACGSQPVLGAAFWNRLGRDPGGFWQFGIAAHSSAIARFPGFTIPKRTGLEHETVVAGTRSRPCTARIRHRDPACLKKTLGTCCFPADRGRA